MYFTGSKSVEFSIDSLDFYWLSQTCHHSIQYFKGVNPHNRVTKIKVIKIIENSDRHPNLINSFGFSINRQNEFCGITKYFVGFAENFWIFSD
jgi:hypothetical protein